MDTLLQIAQQPISSRLWLGSSLYASATEMEAVFEASLPGFITLSLRKQSAAQIHKHGEDHSHWQYLQAYVQRSQAKLLPNTAGCYSAKDAILQAQLARELFNTEWIKLEVIGDLYTLQPHPLATLEAARELIKQGFKVLPYSSDDLILCRALLDAGCPAVMPWAAPIGTGKGLLNPYQLQQLRQRLPDAVLIIDAGLGKPSHALAALEMGYDAVLLNNAVARAGDPVLMAQAFKHAVNAGRLSYLAQPMAERDSARPSTLPPLAQQAV